MSPGENLSKDRAESTAYSCSPEQTISFDDILSKYRRESSSQRDMGTKFEKIMQAFLLTDSYYRERFENVWTWSDFSKLEKLDSSRDMGIDLVTRTRDGEYWAVQCKCFKEGSRIDKPAVDTFLSTSSKTFGRVKFSKRLFISTTKNFGDGAREAFRNQNPAVHCISIDYLRGSKVDWKVLESGVFGKKARLPSKSIRPHQEKALELAKNHYRLQNRGQLIMACGTGKTFT
ncbi:MAG: restriction endonuclease, partial [Rickettsiales bacterium]|nr:restriction endonuclease [Rickettsiales bacterium]